MVEYNIFRPLNENEKSEMIELRNKRPENLINTFLGDLANVAQKYNRLRRPFDSYGARIDFENEFQNKITEMQNVVDKEKFNPKINFGDFSEYADPERFTFTHVTDDKITKMVNGIKNEVSIGKRFHFKTKQRGNVITVFIDTELLPKKEQWFYDNFGKPVYQEEIDKLEEEMEKKEKGKSDETEKEVDKKEVDKKKSKK